MRKYLLILAIGIILFATLIAVSWAENKQDGQNTSIDNRSAGQNVSVEKAKENLNTFLGKEENHIEYKNDVESSTGSYYILKADNSEARVNKRSGQVESIYFNGELNDSVNVKINKDASLAIAKQYAMEKYANFTRKNMQLVKADLIDHGTFKIYSYVWAEMINDTLTPNIVQVDLNPSTGKIIYYQGIDRPVQINTTPVISKDRAIGIAASQFNNITIIESNATLMIGYFNTNTQTLVWGIQIKGNPINDLPSGGYVAVDAVTGKVLTVDPYR